MSVPSAVRILDLIEWLATQGEAVPLTRASQALGLPKSSTLLLLKALVEGGYGERNDEGHYRLVRLPGEPSEGHRAWGTILRIAEPHLRAAVTEGQESGFIAVLTDERRIRYLNKILPDLEIHYDRDISSDREAHDVASGIAILGALPDSEFEDYLAAVVGNIAGAAALDPIRTKIRQAREDGVAVNLKGRVEGASGVAAPILDAEGRPVAAVNLSGPTDRVINNVDRIGRVAREAAHKISEDLVRRTAAARNPGGQRRAA